MTRKGKGRQKIEMVKMKNESNLQVTFSKRKAGIFKKASELCTLCDAEVGLILFSPSHKAFSFGHPNVESVIDRFMNNNPSLPHQHGNNQPDDAHRNSVIREFNENFTKLENDLEFEEKKYEVIKKIREESKMAHNWWEDDVEGFNLSQCKEFKGALENLKKLVALEAAKFVQANSLPNFDVGSSSNAGFGTDGGPSHFRPDFDMFDPRMMVNNENNMTVPGFDGGSGSQANHGFGVDVGSSQNNPGFDMFDPRRMVMNNQNNLIVPGFDGASSSSTQANHGFGVDVGSSENNSGFDMFDPRRMVVNNQNNMIFPGFDGAYSSQANHGFGVDVGSSQNNPGFDMFDPRRMVMNNQNNLIVPGFDGASSSQAKPGFDMFDLRRMVNNQPHNPFINNPNMVVPHNTLQYGNNGNEGHVPDYNMNYGPEFNQNSSQMQLQVDNPNQNQISTSKRENMSEYDEHYRGNPPHPRRDYY